MHMFNGLLGSSVGYQDVEKIAEAKVQKCCLAYHLKRVHHQ